MRFRANVRAWLKRSIQRRLRLSAWPDDGYLILRMGRLEIDQAEPDKVESMPRNNPAGKPNQPSGTVLIGEFSVYAFSAVLVSAAMPCAANVGCDRAKTCRFAWICPRRTADRH
jgi:hypothetical protein